MPTQENREAALQELTNNIKKMLETLSTPDEDINATGSDGNHGRKRHNTYTCEYIAAYALAQMIDPVGPLERTYAYVNTTQGVVKRIEELIKKMNDKLDSMYEFAKITANNTSDIKNNFQEIYNDWLTSKGPVLKSSPAQAEEAPAEE